MHREEESHVGVAPLRLGAYGSPTPNGRKKSNQVADLKGNKNNHKFVIEKMRGAKVFRFETNVSRWNPLRNAGPVIDSKRRGCKNYLIKANPVGPGTPAIY